MFYIVRKKELDSVARGEKHAAWKVWRQEGKQTTRTLGGRRYSKQVGIAKAI